MAEESEAAPLQRAFKHLREVGALQLVENPDPGLGLDGKWQCTFSPAVNEIVKREEGLMRDIFDGSLF